MRTVTIKGIEYKLAYNLRALFTYEQIVGHPYKGEKTIDSYMLLYSMLHANNDNFCLTFEEFIDECDNDMNIFQEYMEVMKEYASRAAAFMSDKKKVAK